MSLLRQIVEQKKVELSEVMAAVSLEAVKNRAAHTGEERSLAEALSTPGLSVIAEFKRRSPSAGPIKENARPVQAAREYEAAQADAISVLTERPHFGGSLFDLREVRRSTSLPVLRKDFVFDEYQVYESKAVGADAILLIAAVLGRKGIERMLGLAADAGLEALVEVHTEAELEDALESGARIIGVNNRDLETFEVDLSTIARLRPLVPDDVTVVSESGCKTKEDVELLRSLRVDAVLIGGALMQAEDPAAKISELFGREGRGN